MTETIISLVSEAKKSKYSLIPQISEDDVLAIWDCLADFIERQMLQVKGVCIQGFGTFTFSQRKIEFGGNKVITIQRPVFVMSESFSQTHSLFYPKQHATGHIPVVSLNYTVLSNGTSYDRDTVEISIREILQALAKALVAYKNINLDFPKIGRLLFREKRARMKFFKEFVRSIDSSGNLEYAFRPRTCPESEGSIMSNPNNETPLSPTLPKIIEASNEVCNLSPTSTTYSSAPSSCVTSSTHYSLDNVKTKASKSSDNDVLYQDRPTTPYHMPRPATVVSIAQPLSLVSSGGSRTLTTSSANTQPRTCCHSSTSGQELCYLCHQRALRNVPISLAEERRLREILQDKLLQDFQQRREALIMANEKCKQMKNKEIADSDAHFNLEEAQRKKCNEKKEHIRNSNFHPSYIFHHRSTTPCYTKKQLEYCQQLDEQVARRRKAMQKYKDQQEDCERQEQLQLSKELDLIQESFATKMAEKKADYQRTLDEQVRVKAAKVRIPSPIAQPVFGVHDISPTKMLTKKQRAKLLYKEQLATVAERQQAMKVEALRSKEEDAHILQHNLEDLLLNLKQSRQERIEARKELETAWQDAVKEKHEHGQKIRKNTDQGSGLLLHDQCKKYLRCNQCQRRRDNVGTSNVLSESRYISGSRLMV